ncbi:tyrosine-protein phosphatase [Parvularcula oceani]|uniref:phosphatase domain-containing protein n=1 Tax=Parvularcula oceani TaxID=1247963 RepID=UPI0004E27D44|nr:tyrosine-protein phosphatase [Parvularcula oceani]
MTRSLLLAACLLASACASAPGLRNVQVLDEGTVVRSGQPSALGLAFLRDTYGVETVINLNQEGQDEEMVAAMALGLDYLPLPTGTYDLERENLAVVIAAIRSAQARGRTPVLIHCRSGQDRTGTAVALFEIIEEGLSPEEAAAQMQAARHWTHRVAFPHLTRIALNEGIREEVSEAAGSLEDIGIILPPDPWEAEPEAAPPGDVVLRSGLVVTTRPGIR